MRRRTNEAGSALLLTTVMLIVMLGLSSAYFLIIAGESKVQQDMASGTSALYITEAGIARAIEELRTGDDLDANGIVGACAGAFNRGTYSVTLADMGDGTVELTGVGTLDGISRAVQVRLTVSPNLPLPGLGAQAAFAILGKLTKKGKVAIHLKHKSSDADGVDEFDDIEPNWTSTSTSGIAVDGFDASAVKPPLPAFGIEDAATFTKVSQKIAEQILKGKIPADAFISDPMNTIFDKKGNPVESSLVPLQTNPTSLNYENMNVIADQLAIQVASMAQTATVIASGSNVQWTGTQTYGSSANPGTFVINANKVEIKKGANITGFGTLIIQGDLNQLEASSFNWTGNVIIMGGTNKDAKFQNHHGNLTIDGTVLVLGTDANKKTSKLVLDNKEKTNESTTKITGAVLVWTGNNTDKEEKAEFKAKHGNFTIDGFIGVYGDKTKFDVKIDDKKNQADGSFILHGGVVVAVPGSNEKHKAKVHLHGDDILIQYDSLKIEAAIQSLMSLAGLLPPENSITISYQVVSWRNVVPPQP